MSTCTSPAAEDPLGLSGLYRAHIAPPPNSRGAARTAFVDACSHNCACKKIAAVIAALEHRQPIEVADRIYNCYAAKELIEEGLSEDTEVRLFETGRAGGIATHFVPQSFFLLPEPAALGRAWVRCPQQPVTNRQRAAATIHA
jgi:hypothetical protein